MMNALLSSRLPLVAAPMAGGPSALALARAVSAAGAFPFLAGGNTTVDALGSLVAEARGLSADFGVNLFVLPRRSLDEPAFRAYAAELAQEAEPYGIALDPVPRHDDDSFDAKIAMLTRSPVPVVSFTFGLPSPEVVAALHAVRTTVLASVTTVEEAEAAQAIGVDGLVVQGPDAGGHSATHDPAREIAPISTAELVRQVHAAVDLPLIGAGGVDGPVAVQQLRAAGAQAVAVGTLLLRTDEAGTSPAHRAALADPAFTSTALTRAFTGRPARSLRNGFIDRHDSTAPTGYPAVHHLTRELRRAAGAAGDSDRLHLWAGTGWRSAPTGSAADVIVQLAKGI